MRSTASPPKPPSEFLRFLSHGIVLGTVLLAASFFWRRGEVTPRAPAAPLQASVSHRARPAAPRPDFGGETPSRDARHVANWSFFTGDAQGRAVVILDKKEARVYTFDPSGRLLASTPALLGAAIGDDAAPGIGDKPLAQIRPEEKTTHAGRFVLEPGRNADGEDVLWVDYDAALSMHRVRASNPAEHRLQRLASASNEDNRISYGCINVPADFFDRILGPAVRRFGAVVYVLPETRAPEEVFGSWDVTDPRARPPAPRPAARVAVGAHAAAAPRPEGRAGH